MRIPMTEARSPVNDRNGSQRSLHLGLALPWQDGNLTGCAKIAALSLILVSVVVPVGRVAGVPILTTSVRFDSGLGFLAPGVSTFAATRAEKRGDVLLPLARLCAGLSIAIGISALLEDMLQIDLGVDQMWIPEAARALSTQHPGRPAPITGPCFTLTGLAMLVTETGAKRLHGLSTLKHIVVRHGGRVWAETDRRAPFHLTLPNKESRYA